MIAVQSLASVESPSVERLNLSALAAHFHLPLNEAADKFGVSVTKFKHACRLCGIAVWPYKRLLQMQKMRERKVFWHSPVDTTADDIISSIQIDSTEFVPSRPDDDHKRKYGDFVSNGLETSCSNKTISNEDKWNCDDLSELKKMRSDHALSNDFIQGDHEQNCVDLAHNENELDVTAIGNETTLDPQSCMAVIECPSTMAMAVAATMSSTTFDLVAPKCENANTQEIAGDQEDTISVLDECSIEDIADIMRVVQDSEDWPTPPVKHFSSVVRYACQYCGKVKTSMSAGGDGRVRIRCECGGKRGDKRLRLHTHWKAMDDEIPETLMKTNGLRVSQQSA
jgi:hypothetical protein